MNCLEFRRLLQTEPESQDPAFLLHKRECAACAPAVRRASRLERSLRESLRVEIPEGLESRILLRHAFEAGGRRRRPSLPYTLAASVLLAAVTLGGLQWRSAYLDSVEHEVVSLASAAEYALAATEPVDDARVKQALQVVGLGLETPIKTVTFASQCIIRGRLAGHLVLRENDGGPVTVFLIPDSIVTERKRIREKEWRGVLVPTPTGTIVVLGMQEDAVALVEDQVRGSVRWRLSRIEEASELRLVSGSRDDYNRARRDRLL